MHQIGTPIETLAGGIALTTIFAALASGILYKAYHDEDGFAAASGAGTLMITCLAGFNTYVLCMGDNSSSIDGLEM